jgi:hypothetical protein
MFIVFFKFRKILILSFKHKFKKLQLISKKKNLFFKKKYNTKILISKRLSIVLKKRKKQLFRNNFSKKIDNGNFFFKKFFYKTLLKSRKFLKSFFFLNKKIRQSKISNLIFKNSKSKFENSNNEYTLLNVLLRSHFFFFIGDAIKFINNGMVYINGFTYTNPHIHLNQGDCVQLVLCKTFYKYLYFCRRFLKKKAALFRFNS